MWTRAETGTSNDAFKQVLLDCEDYADLVNGLIPKLSRPDRVMWYWENSEFRLALCYRVDEDKSNAHIVVGVPSPEGQPTQWCRTMITKLRVEMDKLGIDEWTANQLEEYKSEHMKDFADFVGRVCHEFQGDEIKGDRRRMVFSRFTENKKDDNKFEGKDIDNPPRVQKGVE
jgi:hypothetical protein|tara:strand:- start:1502 stop:2017 length:516 start_codon:yes stop_codon:yes gene_type:complete